MPEKDIMRKENYRPILSWTQMQNLQ
jgi:hypothetical protein